MLLLLVRDKHPCDRWHPDLVTYDFLSYSILPNDFFTDPEAEAIMRNRARPSPAVRGYRPVIIYRGGSFMGMGTLVEKPSPRADGSSPPPYIVTAKHLFLSPTANYYSYEALSPAEGSRHSIRSIQLMERAGQVTFPQIMLQGL